MHVLSLRHQVSGTETRSSADPYSELMSSKVVAKVWWPAPHEGLLERFVFEDQVVVFGRHSSADIRIGHAPVRDATVPRMWGELSWHRGRMFVANLDDNWGFDLVPAEGSTVANRMTVSAGASASPSSTRFQIVAQSPGSRYRLDVMCADPRRFVPIADEPAETSDDPASFLPFDLTATQKIIGSAVRDHLNSGRSRRPSYQQIATATNYSVRTVREAVQVMDALFLLHGLSRLDDGSDSLDRVAAVSIRHPGILK